MKMRLRSWQLGKINIKVTYMDGRELYGKIDDFDELGLEITATRESNEYGSPETILIPWINVYNIISTNQISK